VAPATLGLIVGLIAGVALLENGPGVSPAQVLTMAGGALSGTLIGCHRRRIR
jgi:hypothetical protein